MRRAWIVMVPIGLLMLIGASCNAAKDVKGEFGIGGNVGYALMDIKGVNDFINLNEDIFTNLFGYTTESKDYHTGGISYRGEISYGVTSSVVLTGTLGSLVSTGWYAATGPTDIRFDDSVSATFFGAGLSVVGVLPTGGQTVNLSFGGGADYYRVNYRMLHTETGNPDQERIAEGSKIGYHLGGGLAWYLTDNISLGIDVIYRIMRLPQLTTVKDDWGLSGVGEPFQVYSGLFTTKNLEIDLSGLGVYLGICFHLG